MTPSRRLAAAPRALALTALLAIAAPARAQDTGPGEDVGIPPAKAPEKERRGGGRRIRMGDLPEEPAPPPPPPTSGGQAGTPAAKDEIELWIDELATWPAAEAKQASIRLATQPQRSWPALEARLAATTDDWRTVSGIAATMGKIGDARALEPLTVRLQHRAMYTHSADLLDAIVRIDPVGAKPRLLAQLLHPASGVVDEAAVRLRTRVGPPDVQVLRDILDAAQVPAARAAAVDLLVRADPAEARTSLVAALRDPAPEVAFAAAKALAADDAPEAETVLLRSTTSPVDRQVAYASVALALRGERTGRRTIDDATVRLLLGGRGLAGVDPLSRAAAAVVLADVGYFHEVEVLDEALDRRLVPELIDVVAGRTFWKDSKVFMPLATRRLERLTGRSGATTPEEWRAWWQQASASFRARRVLQEVPADQWATLSVTLRGAKAPGAEGTTFAGSSEALAYAAPDDFAILLGEEDARSLAQVVNASGILRAADTGTVEGIAPVEAVVRAARRERRLAFASDLAAPGAEALLDEAERLRRRHAWQRYRPQAQSLDLATFVALQAPRFAAERSEADRRAALSDLITLALDDARGEAWNVRALEELRALPELGAALGDDGTRRLLARLGRREQLDAVAEGLVLTLAKARRSEAHPLLLDFATTRRSPRTPDLLRRVFEDASEASLAEGFADPRAEIRAAALASLGERSPKELGEAAVRKALEDPDLAVRREAVRALGRLRCEWARADLEAAAGKPGDTRAAAVEALGKLGGKSALAALMGAFAADDPGLRVAAVEALGETREPEAISAVAFAMSMDPSAAVREVASRVLVRFGTERAASELRRLALDRGQPAGPRARAVGSLVLVAGNDAMRDLARLVDDPADEVADEAALHLAARRDPVAVPRLLKMLEKGRRPRAARTALEGVSLELFGQDDPLLVASLYTGWWETTKDRGARGWLVDALALGGVDDPTLRAWEAGSAGREVVPFLVKGLESDNWAVRRAADLALRDLANRSFGDLEPFTPASEVARVRNAWREWWTAQAPPPEPAQR